MQKAFAIAIAVFITLFPLHTQDAQTFTYKTALWTSVLNGKVVLPPVASGTGFIAFSDGKLFSYIDSAGTTVYQKGVKCSSYEAFFTIDNNFIVFVCDSSNIALINSSGKELWRRNAGFSVTGVSQGQDGRLFVKGEERIACFDLMGRKRWQVDTDPQTSDGLCVLNDGSVCCILSGAKSRSTKMARISPFGQSLEVVDFEGRVISCTSTKSGILLSFESGEFGLAKIATNSLGQVLDARGEALIAKAKVDWAFKDKNSAQITASQFIKMSEKITALIMEGNRSLKIIAFKNETGDVLQSFTIKDKTLGSLECVSVALGGLGLFIADRREAVVYDLLSRAALDVGAQLISKNMPPSGDPIGDYNRMIYTTDDTLVLFNEQWLMAAFKVVDKVDIRKSDIFTGRQKVSWKSAQMIHAGFYTNFTYTEIDKSVINNLDTAGLDRGLYSKREADYSTRLFSAARTYIDAENTISSPRGMKVENAVRSQVQNLFAPFIQQLFLLGGIKATSIVAHFIETEKSMTSLRVIFDMVRLFPYDDGLLILRAMQKRLSTIPVTDEGTLMLFSRAVDTIHSFMGSRATLTLSMELQSALLEAPYPEKVRQLARKSLTAMKKEL